MKRTTRLPDAINCDTGAPFYQVPFSLIDDKNLSGKAFKILVMSLRNKEGEWTSYLSAITERMKEGAEAVANGLKELEAAGYLRRVKYRNQQTKTIVGSVWLFTSTPHKFKTEKIQNLLQSHGYEPQFEWQVLDLETPTRETPNGETPIGGNHPLIILKDNNYIKENNMLRAEAAEITENTLKIKPEYFEMFWAMYPKRTQGKGSKGQAKTRWEALCRKPVKDRPRWRDVKVALHKQKKSIQWHDPNFIPLPTTWLNQQRWLDEAAEYAQGSITPKQAEPVTSLKEEIEKNKVRLLAWYREYQKRPDQPYGTVWDEANMAIRLKWERIPYGPTFLEMYSKWLEEQEWISDILPVYFQPGGKMVQRFRQQLEKEIGMDLFTGRTLN